MKYYKKRSRPFLLLEILIAFSLVALCIFPLVSSQVKILTAEKALRQSLDRSEMANALFAAIVERFYRQEITIEDGPLQLGDFIATFEVTKEKGEGDKKARVVKVILESGKDRFSHYLFFEKGLYFTNHSFNTKDKCLSVS